MRYTQLFSQWHMITESSPRRIKLNGGRRTVMRPYGAMAGFQPPNKKLPSPLTTLFSWLGECPCQCQNFPSDSDGFYITSLHPQRSDGTGFLVVLSNDIVTVVHKIAIHRTRAIECRNLLHLLAKMTLGMWWLTGCLASRKQVTSVVVIPTPIQGQKTSALIRRANHRQIAWSVSNSCRVSIP